jgi:hypothetical protein
VKLVIAALVIALTIAIAAAVLKALARLVKERAYGAMTASPHFRLASFASTSIYAYRCSTTTACIASTTVSRSGSRLVRKGSAARAT